MAARRVLTDAEFAEMRSLWEGDRDVSAAAIGKRFGITKNAVIGHANRRKWRRPIAPPRPPGLPRPPSAPHQNSLECRLSDRQLIELLGLWDAGTPLATLEKRFVTPARAIELMVARLGWPPRPTKEEISAPEPTTIFTRIDALHARLDAVLAETRSFVEDRKPVMVRTWADDDPRRFKQAARLRALGGNLRQRGVG